MKRNIQEDLHGIDYVCYFKNGYKHINVIDMMKVQLKILVILGVKQLTEML